MPVFIPKVKHSVARIFVQSLESSTRALLYLKISIEPEASVIHEVTWDSESQTFGTAQTANSLCLNQGVIPSPNETGQSDSL